MVKIRIDIDDGLLDKARCLANVRTKRDAVHAALPKSVRRRHIERLVDADGTSSIRRTPADVRRLRDGR